MKPVLWYHPVSQRVRYDGAGLGSSWIPLYKKHKWVGLTDEEIVGVTCECVDDGTFDMNCARDFARAIEEKSKAKNS
jgi:hypothetical protein